jgi:hypothetical protein
MRRLDELDKPARLAFNQPFLEALERLAVKLLTGMASACQ